MSDAKRKDLENQYDLVYSTIEKKLAQQLDRLSQFDTKASIILALVGILLAGYFQLLSASNINFRDYFYLIPSELILLALAGYWIFKAFLLKPNEYWRDDPEPTKLLDSFKENHVEGEYWFKDQIVKAMAEAYEENNRLSNKKYSYIQTAKKILYAAVILIGAHIILMILGINWQ